MSIAQKEINEVMYWLELLQATNYLSDEQFKSMHKVAEELIKLITSIIKTTTNNLS